MIFQKNKSRCFFTEMTVKLLVSLILVSSLLLTTHVDAEGCQLGKSSKNEKALLDRTNLLLKNKRVTIDDGEHIYYVGFCTSGRNNTDSADEGIVQVNKQQNKKFVIGRLSDVDIEGSDEWIRLTYNNGDSYANACNKTARSGVIMILCNSRNSSETFRMIEENNERDDTARCEYIFEFVTPTVCKYPPSSNCSDSSKTSTTTTTATPTTTSTIATTAAPNVSPNSDTKKSGLGVFSILIIVASSVFLVYIVVGTMYMRYVNQARGWEQVPNWPVWHAIGNRMADICNYVCRCGQMPEQVRTYESITDREADDDNLLNM